MHRSPLGLLARFAPPLHLLLAVLGCAGAGAGDPDEPPPVPPAEVPAAAGGVDTAAEAAPDDAAPDDAAPAAPDPEDDGVAAVDPDRPPERRDPAHAAPAPAPRPGASGDGGTDDDPPDAQPRGKARRPPAPAPPGIRQVDDTTWHVTRKLVEKWQDDPYSLGNVRERGEGWELVGIRQRNAYHLGMRNADIVLEVNGRKLNTMPQLLAAYMALKNEKSFEVVFLRRGARKVHRYRIVN